MYSPTVLWPRQSPVVQQHQQEIAQIEAQLRTRCPERVNLDALEQWAAQWKTALRAEPKVARLLLRRLVGPLTLWEESEGGLRWVVRESATLASPIK